MDYDFEQFLKANERRIHYQIHRLGISGSMYDDFYAEGLVAMWKAYKEHDATKANIGTFINYRIRFRLIDYMRRKLRQNEAQDTIIEEQRKGLTDGNVHRASQLPVLDIRGIELKDDTFWQTVRNELSDRQWKWVHYFIIYDLTIKEIMELENVSADAVKSWGREVRRKLRQPEIKKQLEELV